MPGRNLRVDVDALKEALEDSLGGAAPRRDLWASVQIAVGRPQQTRSRRWALLVVAPAVLVALTAVVFLGTRWMSSGPSAEAVYVTEALGSLFKVSSVYVQKESRSETMGAVVRLDGLPAGSAPFPLPLTEYRDCTTESAVRRCAVVDKATGERIGTSESTGGKRATEGWYVFPSRFFVRTTQELDAELWPDLRGSRRPDQKRSTEEFLYVDGRAYRKGVDTLGDVWTTSAASSYWPERRTPDKLFWGLFENRLEGVPDILRREFSAVEQLEESNTDGVPTRRYRASTSCGEGCRQVLDVWIGIPDGLPRKAVNEYYGGSAEPGGDLPRRIDTFTFSRFNETLEIPPEPRPEEVRRFPSLTSGP